MGPGRSRSICRCQRSTRPFSSIFLFLSWILPSSSYAQLTTSQTPSSNVAPTTLSTSTTPLTSGPSSSSTLPPTQTSSDPPPAAATSAEPPPKVDIPGDHAFNYYFLFVAVFVILLFLCLFWFGRRKKRKAAMMRSQSQRALARDVEGWRTRFRAGRGSNGAREQEREEGLDERGEAPPPYKAGSKPPSITSHEGRSRSTTDAGGEQVEQVELRRMSAAYNPPEYHEASKATEEDAVAGDITRPTTAITASERSGSMRRLLDTTGGSSEA